QQDQRRQVNHRKRHPRTAGQRDDDRGDKRQQDERRTEAHDRPSCCCAETMSPFEVCPIAWPDPGNRSFSTTLAIRNVGRRFTSRKIRARYSPITPSEIICTAPTSKIRQAVLAQPRGASSPKTADTITHN